MHHKEFETDHSQKSFFSSNVFENRTLPQTCIEPSKQGYIEGICKSPQKVCHLIHLVSDVWKYAIIYKPLLILLSKFYDFL